MTEPACKFEDGAIWWRGSGWRWTYKGLDDAERLLAVFVGCDPCDWFKPTAERFASELREAIRAHEIYHTEGRTAA